MRAVTTCGQGSAPDLASGRIEKARLEAATRGRPKDLATYDLWLRGWSALNRPDLAALAWDPHFARADTGLAMANWGEWACFP